MILLLALRTLLICLGEEHLENNSNYWKQIWKVQISVDQNSFSSLELELGTWLPKILYIQPPWMFVLGGVLRHWGCLFHACLHFHLTGTQRRWDESPSSYRAVNHPKCQCPVTGYVPEAELLCHFRTVPKRETNSCVFQNSGCFSIFFFFLQQCIAFPSTTRMSQAMCWPFYRFYLMQYLLTV